MVIPASSSTLERRDTMAFSSARVWHPSASVVMHTTRMASGMLEMRSTTQKESASSISTPITSKYTITATVKTSDQTTMVRSTSLVTFSRLSTSSTPATSVAVRPNNVSPPVAHAIASTSPRITVEPILATSPAFIVIGMDSPVSAAWSTWIGLPSHTMQSAGTAAPDPRQTRSPGTMVVASTTCAVPSRITCASGRSESFRALIASPALSSSTKPTSTLSSCRTNSTMASPMKSAAAGSTDASTISTPMANHKTRAIGCRNSNPSFTHMFVSFSGNLFNPNFASLFSTSSEVSPLSGVSNNASLATPR
mmetsp:Transcript_817/g.2968  ORF Transcript_817/g.2968 Transcript_817/m.2968 type:complete len:309 (-) Transcript_817:199-1125(-)